MSPFDGTPRPRLISLISLSLVGHGTGLISADNWCAPAVGVPVKRDHRPLVAHGPGWRRGTGVTTRRIQKSAEFSSRTVIDSSKISVPTPPELRRSRVTSASDMSVLLRPSAPGKWFHLLGACPPQKPTVRSGQLTPACWRRSTRVLVARGRSGGCAGMTAGLWRESPRRFSRSGATERGPLYPSFDRRESRRDMEWNLSEFRGNERGFLAQYPGVLEPSVALERARGLGIEPVGSGSDTNGEVRFGAEGPSPAIGARRRRAQAFTSIRANRGRFVDWVDTRQGSRSGSSFTTRSS